MKRKTTLLLLKTVLFGASSALIAGASSAETSNIAAPDQVTDIWDLAYSILMFLLVIVLMLAGAWMLKRWQPARFSHPAQMQVKAALSLGGRDRVVVVQAGDRQLLLGVSPGKIVLLGDYDQLLMDAEPSEKSAKAFQNLLNRQ